MAEEKALTFAQYHLYRGDRGAALATLDAQLARQPQSVGALAFKAEMMEDTGELLQAYKLYNAALEAHFAKRPSAQHPPFGLMERQSALSKKLFPETFK
jgi:Tfp pilus assembly protein PilF